MAQPEVAGALSVDAHQLHENFWQKTLDDVRKLIGNDFKAHELPLARIKKIMKLDEEVKMISAEAPVLFSKAAEIFISELSLRAWIHTEENKRRTLQRNDIAMAITKYDQFDFLIDIVPREEIKTTNKRPEDTQRTPVMADQVQYYYQLANQVAQQSQTASTPSQSSQSTPQQQVLQLGGNTIPAITIQPQTIGDTSSVQTTTQTQQQPQIIQIQMPQNQVTQQQIQQVQQQQQQQTQQAQVTQAQQQAEQITAAGGTTQVFQQVLTPSGEVQNVPIQLTPAQIQAITLQMQGKQPGQPILIQTAPTAQSQTEPQQQQGQGDQVADQSSFQAQPLFQVPLNIGGQQVYIQQVADGLQADQGEVQDG